MTDPMRFETRLSDAFERYAAGAPIAVDARALTAALADAGQGGMARSILQRRRSGPTRGLRLAALLATLVAVLLAALLIGASRETSDPLASRLLISVGHTVWVLGPGPSLAASGPLTGRDTCPTLVGGTTVLASHGFQSWEYRSLSDIEELPRGGSALHHDHEAFEVWSQDGTKVAMGDTGAGEVWILDLGQLADGIRSVKESEPIPAPGLDWAAWSPDGLRLALVSTVAGEEALALRIIDVSGDTSVQAIRLPVVDPYEHPVSVAWAPDGRKLAVLTLGSDDADEQLVRVVELATRTVTTAGTGTAGVRLADEGAWSPDSGHLAMVIGSDVVLLQADGEASERFAIDPQLREVSAVRWWPDGRHLLLESASGLASVSPDGSNLTVHASDPDSVAAFHAGQLYVARNDESLVLERFDADDTSGTVVPVPGAPSRAETLCLDVSW